MTTAGKMASSMRSGEPTSGSSAAASDVDQRRRAAGGRAASAGPAARAATARRSGEQQEQRRADAVRQRARRCTHLKTYASASVPDPGKTSVSTITTTTAARLRARPRARASATIQRRGGRGDRRQHDHLLGDDAHGRDHRGEPPLAVNRRQPHGRRRTPRPADRPARTRADWARRPTSRTAAGWRPARAARRQQSLAARHVSSAVTRQRRDGQDEEAVERVERQRAHDERPEQAPLVPARRAVLQAVAHELNVRARRRSSARRG